MSGIKKIRKIRKNYNEAELYFHQDLDGVTSYLAMKSYLESHRIKVKDSHVIQYGSLEFNVKNTKEGRLPVLVDFAHIKDIFVIATDHHDNQAGANYSMSTNFKKSRSNVETISGEISSSDVFEPIDIELIKTIDSADFVKWNLTPEDIQESCFKLDKKLTASQNRFKLGLVVNRLLLALKNKRIKVLSLDKKLDHHNRNLLECLVSDATPSLYSLYLNLKHYINNAICFEYNHDMRSYHDPVNLPTQEQIKENLFNYILTRKEYVLQGENIVKNNTLYYNDEYKIVKQFDIGETFKTGSYDRYVVFKNFPESEWVCSIYKMGLIQIACNPFNPIKHNIHLGEITKELLEKWKTVFQNFRIPITAVKRIAEEESFKLKQKYANYKPIGFTWNDLITFYGDSILYQPNRIDGDLKTIANLDINNLSDTEVQYVKQTMNKLYSDWNFVERQEMMNYKISAYSILKIMSGGHSSITNLQGFNYLEERPDAIQKFFGGIKIQKFNQNGEMYYKYISNSEDLLHFFATEYIQILKSALKQPKIDLVG
jgi:hypothetical protein